jgi:hypothetical protein
LVVTAAADVVSVVVSFVVVRGGLATLADGLVEHVGDADGRARTLVRRTRKRVWVKVHRGFRAPDMVRKFVRVRGGF